ncbi:beta-lactamase [Candidatus Koribacter versatilis Ellin345]|uniref:Beta-lactamase n=1 Tax=Koribacter versatilis (strain Ellin345) TaxID=204669 RepID=Q1IND3_KORVE|nr:serine hydrolase domain-containing protein [Candidatus Koribacter versatilis]ABF41617.1 beta-lactamase [Candidatus Koribacter versatilis Ellin345]
MPQIPLEPAYADQEKQFARAFAILRAGIGEHVMPGATIAVTHGGRMMAWEAFGRFTYDPESPLVRRETIFDLASVTKAVATTTIAAILHERGQLNLNQKVHEHFREFRDGGKSDVTIAMLLSHSSGLPSYEKLFQRCRSREDLLGSAAAAPLAYPPGARSEYSDLAFILLGEILTRIAGEDLDGFAAREIFAPLGMTTAEYCPAPEGRQEIPPAQDDREFRHRTIQGEIDDENASVMGGVAGHAGLFANAYDLALFAECMLRGGAPILKPETVQLFTNRRAAPYGTSFSLGWDTPSQPSQSGTKLSARAFGHLGFTGTSLWIDPVKQLSITLLTNRTWPHRQSQAIKQLRPAVHDAIVEAIPHDEI